MPLTPGIRLGPYEIVSPLGAGGMGEVYRAKDTRLGREVALKTLPAGLTADAEQRARFEREARAASSLNHPHICVIHDVGSEVVPAPNGDGPSTSVDYLVMELLEGETAADCLARGPMPVGEVMRLGAQIADALDRAHKKGLVHRDLKPANIMLVRSGSKSGPVQAKLLDFGLARPTATPPGSARQTSSRAIHATRTPAGRSALPTSPRCTRRPTSNLASSSRIGSTRCAWTCLRNSSRAIPSAAHCRRRSSSAPVTGMQTM